MSDGPFKIGLTGSIGMGKTETARQFAWLGIPVYDADAAVHALYDRGGAAVRPVGEAFPGAVRDGVVDRAELGRRIASSEAAFKTLESIVHPLVAEAEREFLDANRGAEFVVLDIPLLLETGRKGRVDAIVVVSAPEAVQRQRVLSRAGMTAEKFAAILARQIPDAEKRAQADFVVETDKGLDHALEQVKAVIAELRARRAKGTR